MPCIVTPALLGGVVQDGGRRCDDGPVFGGVTGLGFQRVRGGDQICAYYLAQWLGGKPFCQQQDMLFIIPARALEGYVRLGCCGERYRRTGSAATLKLHD